MNDSAAVISLCQALIRAPSFSGAEQPAAAVAARAMRALGYDSVSIDEYGSVLGVLTGATPGKTLLLDAHLDVVAVPDANEWQPAPFAGEIAGDRVWGRGACDDKGVLAAMICGAARVARESIAGQIIVSASVCEETLTGAAIAHILDRYAPAVVVIGEPTELKLGIAQKGRAGIVVEARGKSAHTARPELGDNAVYKMMEATRRLRALALPSDPELGREILELTEIISTPIPGAGFVPAGCQARFVNRSLPGKTAEEILGQLQNALAGLTGVSLQFDQLVQLCYTGKRLTMPDFILGWRASVNSDWQAKILAALSDCGLAAKTFAAPFGTNASVSAARGIPSFIFGPGSIEQAHIVDEWIAIAQLVSGAHAYARIVARCCESLA